MAGQAALLEFRDREPLEAWLRTQPNEVAMIIAVRTALRVLPLLETASPPAGDLMGQRRFAQLVTLLFHSVALTRFVSLYHNRLGMPPWQSTRSLIARIEFNNEAANSVARTVRAALETVLATAPPVAAHAAQFSAAAAYSSVATSKEMVDAGNEAEADIWNAISFDANSFSAGGLLLHQVAERSVWPTGEPDWSLQRWAQLRTALSEIGDWDCWVKWYDSYARGEYIPEAVELIYATVPPEKWDEGPAAVNVWIKERLQQLQGQGTTEETAPLIIKNQEDL